MASAEQCWGSICFFPLNPEGVSIFGFPHFLTGLALMILAWTNADMRYKFRVRVAPIPLQGFTFGTVIGIGLLTLLTDLWRAQGWPVPQGSLLTPAIWQALLGGLFFATFIIWSWYAFIKPPVFSKWNAKRYAQTLFQAVLRGSPVELAVIAQEMGRSAATFVENHDLSDHKSWTEKKPPTAAYTQDIFLLLADKRICIALVKSSPETIQAIFKAISDKKKYSVPVGAFARNVVAEAINDKNSFLYHESEGYETGLMGYIKPLSQTMFADYTLVDRVGTFFDVPWDEREKWDAEQWETYCRIVQTSLKSYIKACNWGHSAIFYRALDNISSSAMSLYKIDGLETLEYREGVLGNLSAGMKFLNSAINALEEVDIPPSIVRARRESGNNNILDTIAKAIFVIFCHSSSVQSPPMNCWTVQHNSTWGVLVSGLSDAGPAYRAVMHRVRRLIYNEVKSMERGTNYRAAHLLGFCLNVMHLKSSNYRFTRDQRALQRALLSWTKKNYAHLYQQDPEHAAACLVSTMSYDEDSRRIESADFSKPPNISCLEVHPVPAAETPLS